MRPTRWFFFFAAALLLPAVSSVHGTVAVSQFFADHMVLQRDGPITVYGTGDPGEPVVVTLNNTATPATTDANGQWTASLPAQSVGGPYSLTITGAANTIELADVLIGDVWLAVGQSNLVFVMKKLSVLQPGVVNYPSEIAAANYPDLRYFACKIAASATEYTQEVGTWSVCSPATAGNYSAVSYYFARKLQSELNIPIGIVVAPKGGTYVETWMDPATLQALGIAAGIPGEHAPGNAFNAMLAPLTRIPLKGFVYYQGESSTLLAQDYASRLHSLLDGWRARWGNPDLPFYYVQIANFDPTLSTETGSSGSGSWGKLRLAASAALGPPRMAMASAVDLGVPALLHFPNKKPLGERLAALALAGDYGKNLVTLGPTFAGKHVVGNKLTVSYDPASLGSGLVNGPGTFLGGFDLAGADGIYYPALAAISGGTVELTCVSAPVPRDVRYAFGNNPTVTLHNAEGLPALPFQTTPVRPDGREYPLDDPTSEHQDGSEGHWKFNGNGLDRSGNGRTLTLVGRPDFSLDAKEGTLALVLNGVDQYGDADMYDPGSRFTISGWVKLAHRSSARTSIQTILSNSGSGTAPGYRLSVNNDPTLGQHFVFETSDGATVVHAASEANTVIAGRWQFLAVTVDKPAGTARFYVDGVDRTRSAATSRNYLTYGDVRIGCLGGDGHYFAGSLDDLRIDAGTLTAAQARAQSIGGLAARWSFERDGCDATGNNHFMATLNGATYAPAPAPDGAYSALLDGRGQYLDAGPQILQVAYTISLWAKAPVIASGDHVLASNAAAGKFDGFRWLLRGDGTANGQLLFTTGNGMAAVAAASPAGVFEPGVWNHLALTVDNPGHRARTYYNGVEQPLTGGFLPDAQRTGRLLFGALAGGVASMAGNLDDVRLYDRVLSAQEVASLAAATNDE